MGFEGQKKLTPTEILAQLDAGEIKPARVLRDVTIPAPIGSIEARVNESDSVLTYSHNGVTVEASYDETGPTTMVVKNPVTNRSIDDQAIIAAHKRIVTEWYQNRQN